MTRNQIDVAGRLYFDLFPDSAEVIDGDHPVMEKIFDAFRVVMKEQSTGYLEIQHTLQRRYMEILGPDLTACRTAQDAEHGGPTHDDTHTPSEWCAFLKKFVGRAEYQASIAGDPPWIDKRLAIERFEENLIHVAGLVISAVQSNRRKRGLTNSVKQPIPPETLSERGESA